MSVADIQHPQLSRNSNRHRHLRWGIYQPRRWRRRPTPASMPIGALGLPRRASNALIVRGVFNVANITALSRAELLTVPGIGGGTVNLIQEKLSSRGLALLGEAAT